MRPAIFVVIVLAFPFICSAQTTWYVPDDFSSIQGAIDGSSEGDTIIVREGTYFERIDFNGKAITVKGSGNAEKQVIDGRKLGSVVTFSNGEGLDSVLDGFCICNGSGTLFKFAGHFDYFGGGIFCIGASPTINNNIIQSNWLDDPGGGYASGGGAGICCFNASPLISQNSIIENESQWFHKGGGIFCCNQSSPTITDNIISDNWGGDGGGISCYDASSPEITNNLIADNVGDWYGGGIECFKNCNPLIANNTITGNWSELHGSGASGGGILCWGGCSLIVAGNVISDNLSGYGSDDYGGGVAINDSYMILVDNIITYNKAGGLPAGGIGYGGGIYIDGSELYLADNIIANNKARYGGGIFCRESYLGAAIPTADGNGYHIPDSKLIVSKKEGEWRIVSDHQPESEAISDRAAMNDIPMNCLVFKNIAHEKGGGLFIDKGSEVALHSFTLAGNTVTSGINRKCGYGLLIKNGSKVSVTNSILWDNPEDEICSKSSEMVIEYCNVMGGWPGMGNIDIDPLFEDPGKRDYHLTRLSPCINRGRNDGAASDDIDGDFRPYMGTMDMGADEFTGTHTLSAHEFSISQSNGGVIPFLLQAGASHAGKWYCMFSGLGGTSPGVTLPGGQATLPINPGVFTDVVLARLNSPYFFNFLSVLNTGGMGSAVLDIPAGAIPLGGVGYKMYFAYAIDTFDMASNPLAVEILP